MSGRPKPGRSDEAEQLHQLTREAHEAAQEVKAAMRDYRVLVETARGEMISELQQYMREQVAIGFAALTAVIEEQDKQVIERVRQVAGQLDEWESDVRRRIRTMKIAERVLAGELDKSDAGRELMRLRGDVSKVGSQLFADPDV